MYIRARICIQNTSFILFFSGGGEHKLLHTEIKLRISLHTIKPFTLIHFLMKRQHNYFSFRLGVHDFSLNLCCHGNGVLCMSRACIIIVWRGEQRMGDAEECEDERGGSVVVFSSSSFSSDFLSWEKQHYESLRFQELKRVMHSSVYNWVRRLCERLRSLHAYNAHALYKHFIVYFKHMRTQKRIYTNICVCMCVVCMWCVCVCVR